MTITNERLAELRDGARMAVEQFPSAKDPRVRAMYQGFADACDELLALRASIEQSANDLQLQRNTWDFVYETKLSALTLKLNDKVSIVYPGYTEVLREIDEALASRAQSERDAARYRWLRDAQCGLELDPACEGIVFKVPLQIEQTRKVGMSGEDVDAAIDAAMAKVRS